MRYAVIADIHSNLEALEVVLADAQEQKCTHYCCIGDVVGYGANPRECLEIVRRMGMPCVKGNHDEYCSMDETLEGFNPHAAEAVQWTRQQLTPEDRQWLRDLKYVRLVAELLDGPCYLRCASAVGLRFRQARRCSELHLSEHQRLFFWAHSRASGVHSR